MKAEPDKLIEISVKTAKLDERDVAGVPALAIAVELARLALV